MSYSIRNAYESGAIGKRTVYWMYRVHPGDAIYSGTGSFQQLSAIPAEMIIHHYDPLRAGQIRGVPAVVQAMIEAKDFDEYDDAELVRKKNRVRCPSVNVLF